MLNFLSLETAPDSLSLCIVCPPPSSPHPLLLLTTPAHQLFPLPQNTHWSSFKQQKVERGLLLLIYILWAALSAFQKLQDKFTSVGMIIQLHDSISHYLGLIPTTWRLASGDYKPASVNTSIFQSIGE